MKFVACPNRNLTNIPPHVIIKNFYTGRVGRKEVVAFEGKVWYNGGMDKTKKYEYRLSENRILHACRYHVVWCPTFRRPVLAETIKTRLRELVEEVCQEKQITVLELDIGPNYVYLHADMPPMEPVNNMVRSMKRKTSSVLMKEFPELRSRLSSLWTLHYFVSTEPEKPVDEISAWMETQPRFAPKKPKKTSEKED